MKKIFISIILSLSLLILMSCESEIILTAPTNFTISAGINQLDVILSWDPNPADENVEGYVVYFNSAVLESTTSETYTHDSIQITGAYYVTAYKGGEESDPCSTLSTVPIIDTGNELAEISIQGEDNGYGWNRTTGQGTTYSMGDDTYVDSIDFYITDYDTGFEGTYEISSPNRVILDPGANLGGTSGWKVTGFTQALSETFDDVTVLPITGYLEFREISANTTYGVYTDDGYYAMVEVQSIDTGMGMVQIRTAFQTVKGLAILEH